MTLRWKIAQFFEIRWWQRYLGDKDKTTYLAWKRDYWTKFLAKSGIVLPEKARILDAGCGPAGIFTIFEKYGTVALDPLLGDYEKNLEHFRQSDYPTVSFVNERLEDYKTDTPYHAVFCLNAINHVADLEGCFDRLTELCAAGGTLAVSIDAHNYGLLKHIFRLFPGDILHPHQYDLEEYKSMLTRRGMTIERSVLIKEELIFNYYLLVAKK